MLICCFADAYCGTTERRYLDKKMAADAIREAQTLRKQLATSLSSQTK
jgi:hypothetical protein